MAPRKSAFVADSPKDETVDKPQTIEDKRFEACAGFFQLGQLGCVTFGQFADAGALGVHHERICKAIVEVADKNTRFASKLDLFIDAGPWIALTSAVFPLIAQIFVNHGMFKAEQLANAGVMHPEALESQMKASMMRAAMEAMQAQRAMEEELARMTAEMNGDGSPGHEE